MSENKFKRALMAPGFLNPDGTPYDPGSGGANVTSVNGETGDVTLTASDVGALPDTYTPPAAPVQSVNGETGDVTLTAPDVGALPDTYTAPQAAAQADSAAADVPGIVSDFNDLLAKLRAAGIMAT